MYIIFDGGNSGPSVNKGYGSFHIYDKKGGKLLYNVEVRFSDPMTNNEAEYNTLIAALKYIKNVCITCTQLTIEGDSELVRQQVLGNWKVKQTHLRPLNSKAVELLRSFNYTYNHIPRAEVVSVLGH